MASNPFDERTVKYISDLLRDYETDDRFGRIHLSDVAEYIRMKTGFPFGFPNYPVGSEVEDA